MSQNRESKINRFDRFYKEAINSGTWITKDDMTEKGFFPQKFSNGKDIRFIKAKYEIEEKKEGVRVTQFRILGLKNGSKYRPINKYIYNTIRSQKCAFLGIYSEIEVDHKNYLYNDPCVLNTKTQTLDDFQPLSKTINNLKREEARKSIQTGMKFDAKKLGFRVSNLNGIYYHDWTETSCEGDILYDFEWFQEKYNEIMEEQIIRDGKFNEKAFQQIYRERYENG